MVKLIAIDLDDTLLRTDCTISPRAQAAIKAASARGVAVTLATGRMYRSARPYALELGLDLPLITYQGALIKSGLSGEELWHCPLPPEMAAEIITLAREEGIHANIYLDDHLYVEKATAEAEAYSQLARVPYTVEEDLRGRILASGQGPSKILLIAEPERLDQLAAALRPRWQGKVQLAKSKDHYLEFTHPEASKGQALIALCRYLDLELKDAMAIGDSFNDLDMIELAGIGVAMGNAKPEVKAIADYVTLANDDDGVAEAIHRFVL
ncbi:Cof-type HAD-IIB family hydrolase [Carboxydocella sp. ULO1]|uniref:Cof-type HAD-IIB family hydrolase n=1 Tax=Carboxydocella sp. ULO1 TaxID=1926599 RepID=UPI0009C4EA8E|nr:Cof-type HAD-IIB family hydrolase [Carboxydocella sp. ULO1]GAW29784.1 hydrolase Cof [Carboxydocella sp. ULO1]